MDRNAFENRKKDHLFLSLDPKHQAVGQSGLDAIHLEHDALPEINFSEVHLSSPCLGRMMKTPFFISGMTAGHSEASFLNYSFARACEKRGWALGVGSQRRELETPDDVDQWTVFRHQFPDLFLRVLINR